MGLTLAAQQRIRDAIQREVEAHLETLGGECIAYDEESGDEWGFKWRNGEARIYNEPGDEDDFPECDVVFRVRVELVGIDPH